MSLADQRGNPLSGGTPRAVGHYETALAQLAIYAGDPLACADAALAESPDIVMAYALKAHLNLLGTDPAGIAAARDCLAAAEGLPATWQEQGHLAAVAALADGRWHYAARILEDLTIACPHDLLALQVGHQLDFFRGDARMLRDRIARALPAWSAGIPGYHAMLSMHAFGLEECGDYARAEASGRDAVDLQPRDGWGQHAVAHVLEMQGRQRDGIAWMCANPEAWSRDSFFAVHNWWHLALYHLDLGDVGAVLTLFDGPIYGGQSRNVMDMVDASAMLWRLLLRDIDVGNRWQAVAEAWAPLARAGNYAFNDAHAMMAFVGAGRADLVAAVLDAEEEAVARGDDNATFTREVGAPVTQAIRAFGDHRYGDVVRLLRPVRNIAHRFGGSHAQRDVIDLTLIEAAFRDGQTGLAAALGAERAAAKPTSPLARLFLQRAVAAAA